MSERLTNHFDYCDFTECRHYDKELAKSDSCNFIHSSREHCLEYAVYNKLKEYEDLEEQGLLLKLPCKVGDIVYVIVEECEEMYDSNSNYYCIYEEKFHPYMLEDIGKYVFLTKEEAEEALRKKVE